MDFVPVFGLPGGIEIPAEVDEKRSGADSPDGSAAQQNTPRGPGMAAGLGRRGRRTDERAFAVIAMGVFIRPVAEAMEKVSRPGDAGQSEHPERLTPAQKQGQFGQQKRRQRAA